MRAVQKVSAIILPNEYAPTETLGERGNEFFTFEQSVPDPNFSLTQEPNAAIEVDLVLQPLVGSSSEGQDFGISDSTSTIEMEGKHQCIVETLGADGRRIVTTWANETRDSLKRLSSTVGDSTEWASTIGTWYVFETAHQGKCPHEVLSIPSQKKKRLIQN